MAYKVSVIIPVYNVGEYIVKTMESLIDQTFKDFELILVNDGSRDNSIAYAETALKNSTVNYKVINKDNEGVSKARNKGIEEATGKYLYFLDGDDYIDKSFLEKMYHCAEKEEAQVVFCGYTHMNASGQQESTLLKVHKYLEKPISGVEAAAKMLNNEIWISAISGFYLREFIMENNISFQSDIKFGEDTIFAVKALANAKLVASVNEPLAFYVRRNTSVTKTGDEKYFDLHRSNIEMLNYNRELLKDYRVERALLEYKIPQSIIRIFMALSKSGNNKAELLNFINHKEIRGFLKGFKINGNKNNLKFKMASYAILLSPSITYRTLRVIYKNN